MATTIERVAGNTTVVAKAILSSEMPVERITAGMNRLWLPNAETIIGLAWIAAIIAVFTPILIYACAGFYTRWWQDDYGLGIATLQHGMWGDLMMRYHTWTGRFSWVLLEDMLIRAFGMHTNWLPPLLISLYSIAITRVFTLWLPVRTAILTTGIFLLTLLSTIPTINSDFYWLAANIGYNPPIIWTLFIIPYLVRQETPKWLGLIGIVLSSFIIGGFNEMATVAFLVITILALCTPHLLNLATKKRLSAYLIGISIAFAIVVAAPGNKSRMQSEHVVHLSVISTLTHGAETTMSILGNYYQWPVYIAQLDILDLPTVSVNSPASSAWCLAVIFCLVAFRKKVPTGTAVWLLLLTLVATFLACTVGVYGIGGHLLPRMYITCDFFALSCAPLFGVVIGTVLKNTLSKVPPRRIQVFSLITSCIAVYALGVVLIGTYRSSALTAAKMVQASQGWEMQVNYIYAHKSQKRLVIPASPNITDTPPPIGSDPAAYSNTVAAQWYGLTTLQSRS